VTPRARSAPKLGAFRSVVTDAPVSYSVYSAFSFYGARRGNELPGTWLVSALGALGHETAAVRQTLYRMESSRELESRVAGRVKFYRLSPAARAEAEAGLAKIMDDDSQPWDGQWTLVLFRPGSEDRVERERLREVLRAEGFASVGGGLYLHPRDRVVRLLGAARGHGVRDMLEVFRGPRVQPDDDDDRAFVARHWNLDAIAARYEAFVGRYEPIALNKTALPLETAFVLRFAVVFDYLEAAWQDPELTPALLPAKWAGARARRLARDLYRRLLPGALAFGDSLLA
jgi:phenylacetic acid degradation operon negative regulatory protein